MDEFNFDSLLDEPVHTEEEESTGNSLGDPIVDPEQDIEEPAQETTENSAEEQTTEEPISDDPIVAFLNSRGIKDATKIPFINDNGEEESVDFKDLSPEEKLDILNELADPGLSQEEINTVNYLRQNNLSLNQLMNYVADQAVARYLNEHPEAKHEKVYSIDEYTDDDLFLADLHNRFPDFTDEELMAELDSAKANPDSFAKKTEAIRTSYKQMEDEYNQEQQQREAQAAEDLRNNLIEVSKNFNEIQLDYTDDTSDSLVVEEGDKQKIISYLMDTDSEGKSAFVRDLENPAALFEIGWLRTQGAEALANTTQYWKGQLAEARSINKKLQTELNKYKNKKDNSVVVQSEDDHKNNADY